MKHRTWPVAATALLLSMATGYAGDLEPGAAIDYRELAFNAKRWAEQKVPTTMYPWAGEKVVLLTTKDDLDPAVMTRFLERLDDGWRLYAELTGRTPRLYKKLHGKPTIAAIPKASLTCGYGCGFVGLTGIEVAGFYRTDFPLVRRDRDSFSHYHPHDGGFDEMYLVQGAPDGAVLHTSRRVARIEQPDSVSIDEVADLVETVPLTAGDLVWVGRGDMHRAVGGAVAHVITVPGFVPGAEIGVDHHLRAIAERLGAAAAEALPFNHEASRGPVVK